MRDDNLPPGHPWDELVRGSVLLLLLLMHSRSPKTTVLNAHDGFRRKFSSGGAAAVILDRFEQET